MESGFFLGVYTNFLKFQHVLKLVVIQLLTQSLSQSVCCSIAQFMPCMFSKVLEIMHHM